MRASLFAKATAATLRWVCAVSWASHALRPEDCFALCCRTARAPCTKSLRKYEFPRLLIPSSFCLPPVVYSPGTIPSHAENSRPFLKAGPLPIAAMIAVAVIGPMPGIATKASAGFVLSSRLLDHRIGFVDPHLQVIEF